MDEQDLQEIVKDLIKQNEVLEHELIRKNTIEEELLNSTQYYKTLIENTLDITMVLSEEKDIVYINGPVRRIFGRESESMIGTNVMELIHPDEKDKFSSYFTNLLEQNEVNTVSQITIPQIDGSSRKLECFSKKIKDPSGKPNILVNSREITEQSSVQENLNDSQEQLLKAQKIAKVGSWEWELEADKFLWSHELHRIFGITSQTYSSDFEEFLKYVHPDDAARVENTIKSTVNGEDTFEIEFRIIRNDGEERILHTKGELFVEEHRPTKIIATGQDITELKNVEQQLREYSEQLKHFNAKQDMIIENERNQIAREIHDDLGQMLTVLKMDVYLVKERAKEYLNEELTSQFRDDMKSIFERFDMLINSVQKITHNLRPEVIEDLGLAEAIKWLCKEFEEQTGIACKFINETDELNDMIKEYKNAFFRIVQQALSNVGEHAEATKAVVKFVFDGNHVILTIWDNGAGIKDDKVRHPNSLGLLSMRERAHYLGGEFTIVGKPDKGTEVTLKIPVDEILFKH